MNYRVTYQNLISKAIKAKRVRNDDIYYELHHIKPKSLYPELANDKTNLVLLTPREHYIAHWLLVKIYPINSMQYAFLCMCSKAGNANIDRSYKVNSRAYQNAKILFSKDNPAKSKEAKIKISKTKKGKNHHYYGKSGEELPNYKPEKFTFINKDGRQLTGTRNFLYNNTEMSPAQVSNVITGYRYSAKGWYLKSRPKPKPKTGEDSTAADKKMYQFYNIKTGEGVVCTRQYFITYGHLKKKTINSLVYKERNSAFGWTVTKLNISTNQKEKQLCL